MKKSISESDVRYSNLSLIHERKVTQELEANGKRKWDSDIIHSSLKIDDQEIPQEGSVNVHPLNPVIRPPERNPFQNINHENSVQIPEEVKVEINNNVRENQAQRNLNIREIYPNFREMWISLKIYRAIIRKIQIFNNTYLNKKEIIILLNILMAMAVLFGFIICIYSISRDCNSSISSIYIVFFSTDAAINLIICIFYILNIIIMIRRQVPNKFMAVSFILSYLLLIINTIACIVISPNFSILYLKFVFLVLLILYTFPFVYHITISLTTSIVFLFGFIFEFIIRLISCNLYKPCQPTEEEIISGEATIQIPLKKLNMKDQPPLEMECAICLCEISKNSDICKLECYQTHMFHFECLEEWARHKCLCPICRALIKCSST